MPPVGVRKEFDPPRKGILNEPQRIVKCRPVLEVILDPLGQPSHRKVVAVLWGEATADHGCGTAYFVEQGVERGRATGFLAEVEEGVELREVVEEELFR